LMGGERERGLALLLLLNIEEGIGGGGCEWSRERERGSRVLFCTFFIMEEEFVNGNFGKWS